MHAHIFFNVVFVVFLQIVQMFLEDLLSCIENEYHAMRVSTIYLRFNSLPNDQILLLSKLKAFADNKK